MKTGKWALFFGLLVVGSCAGATSNYDQLSWSDGPIVYSIDVSAVEPTGDSPETIALGIRAAIARWNEVLGIDFFQVRPFSGVPEGAGNGLQEIYFLQEPGLAVFFATVALHYGQRRKLIEGDIKFLPGHPWFYYHGPLRHEANGDRIPDIYRVALHELGHVLGLNHPRSEADVTIMRSHMSDIDDLTEEDLRDAQLIAARLFEKNAPRITSPHRAEISSSAREFHLRGTGHPFFIPVMTMKIRSSMGLRVRHVRISKSWSRVVLLDGGINRLRFYYRQRGHSAVRFATKVIDAR